MRIKTAPYLATTCKGCFLFALFYKNQMKSSIQRLRFCHSRGFYMRMLTPPQKKIFVKLSERYPQKSYFSWLLSEGTFSCCQMNFWKNVKVFPSNCRVIMRGLFINACNHFFDRKNIFANVYILQSRVLVYMEGLKEKKYKTFSKTVY